ncbi:MFS general substrate transporter [Ganoderma sinense ZZ0214-1]|uniref:MFS general substrate transporter n=1 Tax=Ganoderma sinense ZZ0214-1 TaxID=1077348 RepID=A0A2G8SSN0_9APHY|nr:MFS general substrate transporter [Ganoderma sinense ZZ0214-1]
MPILVFSFILVALKVSIRLPDEVENQPLHAKLRRIDVFGSFTLVGMVGCLLLGLSLKSTEELPWSHPLIWGLLLASVVFCVLFIWVETSYSPFPVMPMRLVKQRTPLFVSLSNFFGSVAAFSMTLVAISTGSVFAGWVMRRTGRLYNLTLFSCLLTVFAASLVAMWDENSAAFHLWFDIVPQGFGMASVITTTLIAMIASVTREDLAVATGITYLFRTTGQVIGVSLSGALLQSVLTAKLRERIEGPDAVSIIEHIRHSTTIIPTLEPALRKAAVDSYADALRVVFICQAAINFICFLCCLPIQENPLPGTHEEQEEAWKRRDTISRTNSEDSA